MQVELSLGEMLLNAISAGRIRHVALKRSSSLSNGQETADDIAKVVGQRLYSALEVSRENGFRMVSEDLKEAYVRNWQSTLKHRPEWKELCGLCGLPPEAKMEDVVQYLKLLKEK